MFIFVVALFSCVVSTLSIEGKYYVEYKHDHDEIHYFVVTGNKMYILKECGNIQEAAEFRIRGAKTSGLGNVYDGEIEVVRCTGDSFPKIGSVLRQNIKYEDSKFIQIDENRLDYDTSNQAKYVIDVANGILN